MKKRIYLDTAAGYANPSSIHQEGMTARAKLEGARSDVARFLGAHVDEIVFTSSGTESNNLAIFGTGHRVLKLPKHPVSGIITSVIEHPSILNACIRLEGAGEIITYLPVDREGLIDPKILAEKLKPDTRLVTLHYVNNEIGVVQSIPEITKVIRKHRKFHSINLPYFHLDACQATRFFDLNVAKLGVDLLTINSGKVYGPEGVGVLYVKRGIKLKPILAGGGQENGLRSGTENLGAIVDFAKALKLCEKFREKESARLTKLRDYFIEKLLKIPGTVLNGSASARAPHNINVSFLGTDSEYVVLSLDAKGVACSSGSACSARSESASYVLKSLDADNSRAQSAVRFTLSRTTTKSDLNYVLKILPEIINRARPNL